MQDYLPPAISKAVPLSKTEWRADSSYNRTASSNNEDAVTTQTVCRDQLHRHNFQPRTLSLFYRNDAPCGGWRDVHNCSLRKRFSYLQGIAKSPKSLAGEQGCPILTQRRSRRGHFPIRGGCKLHPGSALEAAPARCGAERLGLFWSSLLSNAPIAY